MSESVDPIRWRYHGPLTVMTGGLVLHGRGDVGEHAEHPGMWHAGISRLPDNINQLVDPQTRPVALRFPNRGQVDVCDAMTVVVAAGRHPGPMLLLNGHGPLPPLPWRGIVANQLMRLLRPIADR